METLATETQSEIRRPRLLLDVRNYQCSFLRSSLEAGLDSFGRGTGNGSHSLHDEGGRLEGMPSADRGTGTRDELSGSDEPDTSHLLPCCQITARVHYKIGRLDRAADSLKFYEQGNDFK